MSSDPQSKRVSAVQLRVAEVRQRDVGKARARLDPETLAQLKISPGEVIEIVGKRSTAAIALSAEEEDETLSIMRIDGQTRKNAGVALNEFATVRKIEHSVARSISLSPFTSKAATDRDFADFVKNRLKGMPVMVGDEISVIILGNPLLFRVEKVRPKSCVVVEQSTQLSILPDSLSTKKKIPTVMYDQVGGLTEEVRRLREIVELPLRRPEIFQKLGVEPPNGILLHGPPGCGKTLLARALANECEASFYTISGPEIMNKYYGETEGKLRELFKEAKENSPSIIFIDEIDALAPKREEAFGDVEKRVVAQLLSLMDGVADRGDIVVIGATNRPDSIDPALRRPGRFDREVQIGVPNPQARHEILLIHTRGMPLAQDVDLGAMSSSLHGYTGADIRALCREAAMKALRRYVPDIDAESPEGGSALATAALGEMQVSENDFREASKDIVPTAMREFYTETPKVTWNDIGGLSQLKKTIQENVIWAMNDPSKFSKVGVSPPKGLLLYGPPGCGKSLVATALANESGANLVSVRGPEVLSKWLGESEKAIREIFRKAKSSVPCVVLFDEIDSIALPRSGSYQSSDKVLSQLLTEIDSSGSGSEVFIVGATSRPDLLDTSLLRPGRLELLLYVPPPDEQGRAEALKIHSRQMPLSPEVRFDDLASRTKGYSGADLKRVCREAGVEALRRDPSTPIVTMADFELGIARTKPILTSQAESWYQTVERKIQGTPTASSGFIG